MNEPVRLPVQIHVPAHLLDHRIMVGAVLPGAHALSLMADAVEEHTGTACRLTREALFQGFLILPASPGPLPAFVEIRKEEDGSFDVSLLTRIAARNRSVSRMKEHLRARFHPSGPAPSGPPDIFSPTFRETAFPVDREAVYRELVPFGPAFRNCTGPVLLTPDGVSADITAPATPAASPVLGSPFVFDAALHAVNVWTQRYRGIVVFPVGYTSRYVQEPTQAGGSYVCRAIPHPSPDASSQTFDLWILDSEGRVNEAVLGLRMRELFPGKLRPPDWILP